MGGAGGASKGRYHKQPEEPVWNCLKDPSEGTDGLPHGCGPCAGVASPRQSAQEEGHPRHSQHPREVEREKQPNHLGKGHSWEAEQSAGVWPTTHIYLQEQGRRCLKGSEITVSPKSAMRWVTGSSLTRRGITGAWRTRLPN